MKQQNRVDDFHSSARPSGRLGVQQLVHHQGFEIIVCTPGNAKSRPAFHVLAHQQLKLVVVTVRGTKDFKDVLSDLHAEQEAASPDEVARKKVLLIVYDAQLLALLDLQGPDLGVDQDVRPLAPVT